MSHSAMTWQRLEPTFGDGFGARAAFGLLVLDSDRVCARDVEAFMPRDDGFAVFSTRLALDQPETPDAFRALAARLEPGAALVAPGAPLDAIAFGCTAAAAAIGSENVRRAIQAARPGVPVTDPMEAAIAALLELGARRVALLVPTADELADVIAGVLEAHGPQVVARGTFDVDGDPLLNRVSAEALIEAGLELGGRAEVDAVFLSCTGMRTRHVLDRLEHRLGKPVVTSNQALAWRLLRLGGHSFSVRGRGRLLRRRARGASG